METKARQKHFNKRRDRKKNVREDRKGRSGDDEVRMKGASAAETEEDKRK